MPARREVWMTDNVDVILTSLQEVQRRLNCQPFHTIEVIFATGRTRYRDGEPSGTM